MRRIAIKFAVAIYATREKHQGILTSREPPRHFPLWCSIFIVAGKEHGHYACCPASLSTENICHGQIHQVAPRCQP